MTKTNPAFQKPETINPPCGKNMLWCYFCEWHMRDSMTARKRLGQHMADRHADELIFTRGERPPALEDD